MTTREPTASSGHDENQQHRDILDSPIIRTLCGRSSYKFVTITFDELAWREALAEVELIALGVNPESFLA